MNRLIYEKTNITKKALFFPIPVDSWQYEYRYDDNGNRIEKSSGRGFFKKRTYSTYNNEDEIDTVGNFSYTYDVDGYLTTKSDGTNTTTYEYGSLGELKSVTLPNQTVISYIHNANNQRVTKLINGVAMEKYLWADLTTLLAIYNADGTLKQRFDYGDGRMPLSMFDGNVTYYLSYDQVGSLRVVTDSNGNIVKEITYDSFGNILTDSNSAFVVPFGFAGGLFDSDTKLTRFGYRDYDSVTGKWTSKDPISFGGGDTNLLAYVGNDPINYIDPNGLEITVYGSDKFKNDVYDDINKLLSGAKGKELFNLLMESPFDVDIVESPNSRNACSADEGYGPGILIEYSPSSTTGGLDSSGSNQRPPFIGLAHELGHAEDNLNGISNNEINSLYRENQVRKENDLLLRPTY